ncbi:4-(cytidine 5'-diphospho)-2-C-methyl-D-erythritol kinase [uncultured Roseivirga sp.]|uniref:4-(cytidine 5'-diphospho)-2-C-methyl-D-erythritol kinase n=1 Tax=uncultured Roseivirga sp. TaxID=543088 RepID=UPI0030DD74DD|tara:strand:+ start:267316 stop:268125 length:810 start_codon:yes stop_codon:yes gene_type:complete
MVTFPNAKINLGLSITRKLHNGYHSIESCLYPIPWCDVLEFIPGKKISFSSSGIAIPGEDKDNLVLKAYKLLRKDFGLPELNIHLHKIIPMGAGLGGGSADAAFMLKMLNNEFQLFLDDSVLEDYAAQLGSDCPFFIQNKPAIATGTGTDLEVFDLDLSGMWMLLVKPDVHISTQEAYANVTPKPNEVDLKSLLESKDFTLWREKLVNDFEASIFPNHPALREIKEALYQNGAVYAAMSGSGSTLFGLYTKKPEISPAFGKYTHKLIEL